MIGQGRPKASSRTYSDKVFCTGLALGLCLGFLLLVQTVYPTPAKAESMRLRIAWGGSLEQLWRGTVSVVGGTLEEPRPLGIEADETGSMWIEDDRLIIRQRSPRTYDGVDLLVTAPLDATLVVELAAEGPRENPARFKILLAELVEKSTTMELDDQGSRLLIRRSPGDVLRVECPGRSLVLSPGETLPLSLQPHLLPSVQGDTVELEFALVAARTSQPWWSRTQTISNAHPVAIPLEIPAPGEEGVYDLIITARQAPGLSLPRGGRVPLGWKKTLAQRKIQFVVVGSEPRGESSDNPGTLAKVVEIDPVNPKWWERFAKLPKIPGLPWQWNEPFGNGHRQVGRHTLGPVVQLAPSKQASDLAWEAYPLPVDQPGVPHVLEVDYPSDAVQELGISVMEPDASGALLPIQLDSGVLRPEGPIDNPRDHSPRWNRHRLIFWPHTKSPVVLISNLQRDKPALYGKIRVLAGWSHLPRALPLDEAPARRLFGAYFDRPLFPQSFSASEALDEWSHRSLDDWVTFHEGSTRMVEYLHHVGYGGLMLSVWADGSTLYPSDVLEPTPRYDKGAFFSTGQDPTRKDVLEMLFRLFDREGLRLIPALEFSTPLPELEALLRRGGPECVGIQWIGADGGTWQQTYSPRRGLAPYYNVLHPRVQEAMLSVVREVATTYAEHPSCAGLALQLSAWGYAQLPGPAWGMDDATIAQFERDTDIQVPGL